MNKIKQAGIKNWLLWSFPSASILKVWAGVSVPWFWICREMNLGLRGPSGDEPLTHRLMSVKSGSDDSVKLQPRLTPPSITMYFGHSAATSSPLCLQEPRPRSECLTDIRLSSVPIRIRICFCSGRLFRERVRISWLFLPSCFPLFSSSSLFLLHLATILLHFSFEHHDKLVCHLFLSNIDLLRSVFNIVNGVVLDIHLVFSYMPS